MDTTDKINALLEEAGITQVCYIDDAFTGDKYSYEAFFGLIEGAYIREDVSIKKFQQINFVESDSQRERSIKSFWDSTQIEKRIALFSRFKDTALEKININKQDTITTIALDKLFGPNYIKLSPAAWGDIKEKILPLKSLILFDQALEHDRTGSQLLEEAYRENPSSFYGILTQETQVSGEKEYKKELSTNIDVAYDNLIVLSKSRSETVETLADGIKKALLVPSWSSIKTAVIELLNVTIQEVKTEINDKFDAFVFDNLILASSEQEGISETETFFRLVNILYEDKSKKNVLAQGLLGHFNSEVRLSRQLSKIRFKFTDLDLDPSDYSFSLRHSEVFEDGLTLNGLHTPINNGDIFKRLSGNGEISYFILLTQPCDLMVRASGERNAGVSFLLRLEIINRKASSKVEDPFRYIDFFDDEGAKCAKVHFRNYTTVSTEIFDLSVFNTDGDCRIDIDSAHCPESLHSPWENRFKNLLDKYTKRASNLDEVFKIINSSNIKVEKKPLLRNRILFSSSIPHLFKDDFFPYQGEGKFDFHLSRIKSLRPPYSKSMLEAFNRHLSRGDFPHDFTDVLR